MPPGRTIPVNIAVTRDGVVWFTIEMSDAIGRLKDGKIEKLAKGSENLEPLGLAVAADGSAWYTDSRMRAISRVSSEGTITSFNLSTPVARLGRLAVAPDGAVWFAEPTTVSVTRLKDGVFRRHAVAPLAGAGEGASARSAWRSTARSGVGDGPRVEQARAHLAARRDGGVRAADPPERTR
jgi:virginiamycin B lyase